MTSNGLSLVHRVHAPATAQSELAPLLLMLHGIGSNEDDLFALTQHVDERFFVVSARAPIVMGPGSYAWFNLEFTAEGMVADLVQAEQSGAKLIKFISEVTASYPVDPSRVYLMGFSQGAVMSLSVALARPQLLSGIVAMSGRFPSGVARSEADAEALERLDVMVTHGLFDPVLPIHEGREIRDELKRLSVPLTYREYPMGHEVSRESLDDVSNWLTSVLDKGNR